MSSEPDKKKSFWNPHPHWQGRLICMLGIFSAAALVVSVSGYSGWRAVTAWAGLSAIGVWAALGGLQHA